MARHYVRNEKGEFAETPGGGAARAIKKAAAKAKTQPISFISAAQMAKTAKPTAPASKSKTFQTDKGGTISREEAAVRMFGTKGAAKKLASAAKRKK